MITELVDYLDAKFRVREDIYIVPTVLKRCFHHLYNCYKHKVNFWYQFEETVCRYPGKNALIFPRKYTANNEFDLEIYTYKELYDVVLRLSHVLVEEYGVCPDEIVAMDYTNKPMFIFLWFALWNIGAKPAFLNFNVTKNPLIHCLKVVESSHLFVDFDVLPTVKDTLDELQEKLPSLSISVLNEDTLMQRLLDQESPSFRQADQRRNYMDNDYDIGALIYTSGTTGLPKSAIMSWRKAFMASSFFGHVMRISSDSVVFTAMPLYHSTAAMLGVLPVFGVGGCVVLASKFSVSSFWTQAKVTGATHIQYVGEVCRYLMNSSVHPDEKNHHVKVAYGNGLRSDIWRQFKERFNIEAVGEFYAATEAPFATTCFQTGNFGIGACRSYGKFVNSVLQFQHCIVKIDPEDPTKLYRDNSGRCHVADFDEPGELVMKIFFPRNPKSTFQGYLNNKRETESKVARNVFHKNDAWYRSGDLLRMDKDGLLYFIDRLGDTFRWKSENVSTTEVENEVLQVKGVKQCCVVGAQVPNHEGRAGYCVIEKIEGITTEKIIESVASHLQTTLPSYARPVFIRIDIIPMTDNHKVSKKDFKDPHLPRNKSEEIVYYLDGKTKEYQYLSDETWSQILEGSIRL
ncbi:BA75_00994T0 [Komagataella pastoris]|uniref:Very long-chain fatty acid transport protein n=1 Tax=Komagataella pastoris TaxID=4922 RepID=A0A1B2J5Q5_PICPA|nr:BA75_00994T0 [Komagataella pastoris]